MANESIGCPSKPPRADRAERRLGETGMLSLDLTSYLGGSVLRPTESPADAPIQTHRVLGTSARERELVTDDLVIYRQSVVIDVPINFNLKKFQGRVKGLTSTSTLNPYRIGVATAKLFVSTRAQGSIISVARGWITSRASWVLPPNHNRSQHRTSCKNSNYHGGT